MQVRVLNNPTTDEFRRALESTEPNFVYLQGEQLADSDEVGSLVFGDTDLKSPEVLCEIFGSTIPTTVSDTYHHICSWVASPSLKFYTFRLNE